MSVLFTTPTVVAGGVELFREVVESRPDESRVVGFVHVEGDLDGRDARRPNVLIVSCCRGGRCGNGLEAQFSVLCERTWMREEDLFEIELKGSATSPSAGAY